MSCSDTTTNSTSEQSLPKSKTEEKTTKEIAHHAGHNHFDKAGNYKACSYDGSPVVLNPGSFRTTRKSIEMIDKIMSYVGLPQNFIIKQTPEVPNAAAVIMLNSRKIPERIIAYNPNFMEIVMERTDNNNWAPISIMAHEIGHHLCGHTITAGGSQPPLELESDKFSGFVLQKMGASLEDAQKAMAKLTKDNVPANSTHPPRSKRLRAIEEGWKQACTQNKWGECDGSAQRPTKPQPSSPVANTTTTQPPTPTNTNTTTTPTTTDNSSSKPSNSGVKIQTNPTTTAPVANQSSQSNENATNQPTASPQSPAVERATAVVLPRLSDSSIPSKFDRYIYDEANVLTDQLRATINTQLKNYAANDQLEIVTIVTNDLQGKNMEDYAYSMLHQLRVGRMDIGNGVCLVVNPSSKNHFVALMPGLRFSVKEGDLGLLKMPLDMFYQYLDFAAKGVGDVNKKQEIAADALLRGCKKIRNAATSNFMDWQIKYQSISDMQVAYDALLKDQSAGKRVELKDRPVFKKLVSFQGKVISNNGSVNNKNGVVNVPPNGRAVEVELTDGQHVILLLNQYSESLYPASIEAGKSYSFIARENSIPLLNFSLISYDLL